MPSLDDEEIGNFYFKLKLTGNETDEIIIIPGNDKHKNYLLTYNNNNNYFKFILKTKIKTEHNYKFKITYSH